MRDKSEGQVHMISVESGLQYIRHVLKLDTVFIPQSVAL